MLLHISSFRGDVCCMYVACKHVNFSFFYLGQCSLVSLFSCVDRTLMWLMEVKLLDRFIVLVRCKHVLINWEFSCSLLMNQEIMWHLP